MNSLRHKAARLQAGGHVLLTGDPQDVLHAFDSQTAGTAGAVRKRSGGVSRAQPARWTRMWTRRRQPSGGRALGGPCDRFVTRHRRTAGPVRRPAGHGDQLHSETVAGAEQHPGADRPQYRHHGGAGSAGRCRTGGGPRHRHRRVARHDGTRLDHGRLAGSVPAGPGGRHPRAGRPHLAGRQQFRDEAGDRTPLCLFQSAQRGRSVRVLRSCGRLPDHRQRGRRQALRHERPLQPAAPGLHHPSPGGRRMDRRGGPRTLVPRPGLGRPGERLHQPQHHLHDLACCTWPVR